MILEIPSIRTRFAPSPTGELHIGGARTALFNYLFTKKNNGEFLLRIEDTDTDRLVSGADKRIMEALFWLDLKFDGETIYQSKRLNIYKKYAQNLIADGKAYWCHCSEDRLKKLREDQIKNKVAPRYDNFCREKNLGPKEGAVIRLKIPEIGETIVDDLIRGKVIFKNELLDDQVLLKSDGYSTYHLANVIDDHEMQISHAIRSDEWLSSTPKHLILYQALGWEPPKFAHLSMILGPDKAKLSKRHGATSILEYRDLGYLPEAVINFIAFLGWNPGDEREIFSLKELEQEFNLDKVTPSAAIFNLEKLDWFNGYYIRKMDLDKLAEICIPYLEEADLIKKFPISNFAYSAEAAASAAKAGQFPNNFYPERSRGAKFKIIKTNEIVGFDWIKKIVALEQERIKKLSEIGERSKFFFVDQPDYEKPLLRWKKMTEKEIRNSFQILFNILNKTSERKFKKEKLQEIIMPEAEKLGDRGIMLWPMRAALSGQKASPGPFEIAEVLGKEKTVSRLKAAIEKLSI